jgi:hypothetical protein
MLSNTLAHEMEHAPHQNHMIFVRDISLVLIGCNLHLVHQNPGLQQPAPNGSHIECAVDASVTNNMFAQHKPGAAQQI